MDDLFKTLENNLKTNRNIKDIGKIKKAYLFAKEAHKWQKRKSWEDYIIHPVAVAGYLSDLWVDDDTICAWLLHDVVEDTGVNELEIKEFFWDNVAYIVNWVTKLECSLKEFKKNWFLKEAQNLRKMFNSMNEDLRIVILKICDRLHNMKTLWAMPKEKQIKKSNETMNVIIPITKTLWMWEIKKEMEDCYFSYINRDDFLLTKNFLDEFKKENEIDLKKITEIIPDKLLDFAINSSVKLDFKWVYEISQSCRKSWFSLHEYVKPFTIVVIVPNPVSCYWVMEKIHSFLIPVQKSLKDYMSNPKNSYYKALHTSVVWPWWRLLDIRIMTEASYEKSKKWIIWILYSPLYDNYNENPYTLETPQWLFDILKIEKEEKDDSVFMKEIKQNILSDKIFVISNNWQIVNLPEFSTWIDYLFYRTKDLNKKWKLKINWNLCSYLRTLLRNWDVVEVTQDDDWEAIDSLWLIYSATHNARCEIKRYLSIISKRKAISFWEKALLRELRIESKLDMLKYHINILEKKCLSFWCDNLDDLLEKIWRWDFLPNNIYKKMINEAEKISSKNIWISMCALVDRKWFFYEILEVIKDSGCNIIWAKWFAPPEWNKDNVTCQVRIDNTENIDIYALCTRLEKIKDMWDIFLDDSIDLN